MRVGIGNRVNRDLHQEIQWAATNGYSLFEVHVAAPGAATERGDWVATAALLRELGIDAMCRADASLPVESASPIVRMAALDEFRRTIDVAQVLGASLCTVCFKGWPAAWPEATGYEAWRQLLTILARHGAERGVTIALANGSNNTHQLKHLREIFRRVPDVGLALDVGKLNINTARGLTRDYLFAFGERLRHVRIGDNDGTADQQLPFGAPAAGGIDLEQVLRELRSFGYAGDIGLAIAGDRRWLAGSREMVESGWLAG